MVKRAFFQGERDNLQHFIDVFYDAQGKSNAPIIEDEMDVVLEVKEEKNEEQFQRWAMDFGLDCEIIETTN